MEGALTLKRQLAALALGGLFLLSAPAQAAVLTLDGEPLNTGDALIYENTTFVPLRNVIQELLPGSAVWWEDGRAAVQAEGISLTAQPGDNALVYNGSRVDLPQSVRLEAGRTLVPIRPLATLLGLEVNWDPATGEVALTTPGDEHDELYWLSRIISAESQGECWEGKIAVGNVVLNRVASPDFPDTIYGVIFDDRWGGQFEPVRNGTVYYEPTAESVRAAVACLAGANEVGDSLYFLAPELTDNHWTMENRTFVTTIGAHWFYK